MCNEHRRTVELGRISDAFAQLRIPLRFPEGAPNLASLESIKITDPTAMVREQGGAFELVQRRWSWPRPTGKPVFNYRAEGRSFDNKAGSGRCLIVADGFYEYTAPEEGSKRKTRWLFTKAGEDVFGIAGLWRTDAKVGEACTMLTVEPGPDVAPYHNRQIVIVPRADWGRWLDGSAPAAELLRPSPAGSLAVKRA
ncbi:MAG TPA: SOS response-associated peptidase [Allosphingosinicella sp.]|nr:SOS response-associated peptidase [Allosphingosinicella sp.]